MGYWSLLFFYFKLCCPFHYQTEVKARENHQKEFATPKWHPLEVMTTLVQRLGKAQHSTVCQGTVKNNLLQIVMQWHVTFTNYHRECFGQNYFANLPFVILFKTRVSKK
jgi:hypothetical protein